MDVIVPQSDIDRLEKARVQLCKMIGGTEFEVSIHFGITDIMYKITHRKYKKASFINRLINWNEQ